MVEATVRSHCRGKKNDRPVRGGETDPISGVDRDDVSNRRLIAGLGTEEGIDYRSREWLGRGGLRKLREGLKRQRPEGVVEVKVNVYSLCNDNNIGKNEPVVSTPIYLLFDQLDSSRKFPTRYIIPVSRVHLFSLKKDKCCF